ncbi:MAG: hypothetical protein ACKO4W_07675 [Bacteroidota bacterium]
MYHLNGAVSATNNGISLIPTFSLGKPATIIELNAGGEHLTFLAAVQNQSRRTARALGFSETTHFNNFFKKHVQVSPLRYKNSGVI